MESDSPKKYEYEQLELTLKGYGVFEAGMQFDEMQQLLRVMELSKQAQQSQQQEELWESQGSLPLPTDLFNSTMIATSIDSSGQCSSSADSPENENNNRPSFGIESPNEGPIRLMVCAQVHHAHNWSPPAEADARPKIERIKNFDLNSRESEEFDSKHSHTDETPNSNVSVATDSGSNWDERGSSFDESLPHSIASTSGEQPQRMVSTSSAAVSDMSHEEHSSAQYENSSSQNHAPRGTRCVDSLDHCR